MPDSSSRPLAGKVALITGASSGIGRATVVALAKAGATLAVCGRRQDALEQTVKLAGAFDVPVRFQSVDVSNAQAVNHWVTDAIDAFGRIDVLVNSAGTNTPQRSWAQTSPEAWNDVIATNLNGVYFCTQAVLPTMRAQNGGLIINVSSIAGVQASLVSGVAYGASKHGVVSLTQSLNLEEWRHGIRATVVCPGEVATEILDKRPNPPNAAVRPLMIQPEDLGEMMVYLATLHPRVVIEQIIVRPTAREY